MVKFKCRLCGKKCHDLSAHVEKEHNMDTEQYLRTTGHYVRKLYREGLWYVLPNNKRD